MGLLKITQNKHTVFLALLIVSAIIVRIIWSLWGALEYWGDGYHNVWIILQSLELGEYFDYKDRHLVWLPAYRFLLWLEYYIFDPSSVNNHITPLVLQFWYMIISIKFLKHTKDLYAGYIPTIFVLFWPLPILFGGFNMSESLALCTITSIFYYIQQSSSFKPLFFIAIFSAITALSRHEATAFLGIYTVFLFFYHNRNSAYAITIGVIIGLCILCLWNWMLIEDPFFWLSSKFNASSAGAAEFIETIGFLPRISEAFFAVFLVIPFLPYLIGNVRKSFSIDATNMGKTNISLMHLSTFAFLIVFLVSSLFFFHGADPKYLLIVSFPCALWSASALKKSSTNKRTISISILLLFVPLYGLLFHIRSYNLELERRLGATIHGVIPSPKHGILWCDFPTVLVHADWNPNKIISTDQVQRYLKDSTQSLSEILKQNNVEYIVSGDYDHSNVLHLFKEMNSKQPFSLDDIHFTPVKLIDPTIESLPENIDSFFPKLVSFTVRRNKELIIWKLSW